MIIAVFIRRLKEGATFEDFIREWEADVGFGVKTRVVNAPSLSDPREVISIGFVDVSAAEFHEWASQVQTTEAVRHARIDTVIESTQLKDQYELLTEHDFTDVPTAIQPGSADSLFAMFRS